MNKRERAIALVDAMFAGTIPAEQFNAYASWAEKALTEERKAALDEAKKECSNRTMPPISPEGTDAYWYEVGYQDCAKILGEVIEELKGKPNGA